MAEEIRRMSLGQLIETIEAQNPGLSEKELLNLEVKIRTIHHTGQYNTVTKPRDIEFHTQWNNKKNINEGDVIINCVFSN